MSEKKTESGNGEFRANIHKPQWRKMADALLQEDARDNIFSVCSAP